MPELLLSEPPHPARTATARMVPAVVAALVRMVVPLWKIADWKSLCPTRRPRLHAGRTASVSLRVPKAREMGPETRRGPRWRTSPKHRNDPDSKCACGVDGSDAVQKSCRGPLSDAFPSFFNG